MLDQFEIVFADGAKVIVNEANFARACIAAAHIRLGQGASTAKELTVDNGWSHKITVEGAYEK